jgi:hypothetical protein
MMDEQDGSHEARRVERPVGLLYHYTTLDGLLGIIDRDCLRATHVRFFNDREEFRDAYSRCYRDEFIECLAPGISEEAIQHLSEQLIPSEDRYETFLISFTDDEAAPQEQKTKPGDRLSQWRAYSQGSGGFSLGFDCDSIMNCWEGCQFKRAEGGAWIHRCIYNPEQKLRAVAELGSDKNAEIETFSKERFDEFIQSNNREPNDAEKQELLKPYRVRAFSEARAYYFLHAARFKNEAFAEEYEWRIAFHAKHETILKGHTSKKDAPITFFRHGKFGVTPYVEYPLNLSTTKSPLRKIVIGPTAHMEEAEKAVKLLLECKGIITKSTNHPDGVAVETSKIPYRD